MAIWCSGLRCQSIKSNWAFFLPCWLMTGRPHGLIIQFKCLKCSHFYYTILRLKIFCPFGPKMQVIGFSHYKLHWTVFGFEFSKKIGQKWLYYTAKWYDINKRIIGRAVFKYWSKSNFCIEIEFFVVFTKKGIKNVARYFKMTV